MPYEDWERKGGGDITSNLHPKTAGDDGGGVGFHAVVVDAERLF
jgi:hypothetical protein